MESSSLPFLGISFVPFAWIEEFLLLEARNLQPQRYFKLTYQICKQVVFVRVFKNIYLLIPGTVGGKKE